jgi:hypothetical protein
MTTRFRRSRLPAGLPIPRLGFCIWSLECLVSRASTCQVRRAATRVLILGFAGGPCASWPRITRSDNVSALRSRTRGWRGTSSRRATSPSACCARRASPAPTLAQLQPCRGTWSMTNCCGSLSTRRRATRNAMPAAVASTRAPGMLVTPYRALLRLVAFGPMPMLSSHLPVQLDLLCALCEADYTGLRASVSHRRRSLFPYAVVRSVGVSLFFAPTTVGACRCHCSCGD